MKLQKIEISYKTIIFTAIVVLGLAVLWLLRDLILLFFTCFLLMEVLNPAINKLQRIKIPRILAIFIIYVIAIAVFSFSIASIVPIFVEQMSGLIRTLPTTLQNIKIFGTSAIDYSTQFKIIESLPAEVAKAAVSIFSNLFTGLLTLVITFYLLLERSHFERYIEKAFNENGRGKALKIINLLENRLASWVGGELILMLIIGILSYIAYLILGLPYALPLAFIAGLLEIVPNIGPIITTGIATLVAFNISPVIAFATVIAGLTVHQLENNFITPKIMKETVGLPPLVTILVIIIGAKLAGITGAVLGVPIFLTFQIIFGVLFEKKI